MNTVRYPKQQRGRQTKQRIMKAAFQLFAEKGIHGTNSKEIVAKAGVSIGSFYAYFQNKKLLLLEMLEDYAERHYARIWQHVNASAAGDWQRADIEAIIRNVFKAYDISPQFHRQTHALRYSDPEINRIYDRERNREISQIEFLLKQNDLRLQVADTRATAIIIQNAVENVAHTAKFIGTDIAEDRLIQALTEMIYSLLAPK